MYKIEKINNFGTAFIYLKLTSRKYRYQLQNIGLDKSLIAIGICKFGKPIGLVIANIKPKIQFARINSIFVLPSYRCQGIATALLVYLEKELFLIGCTKIKMFCPMKTPTAIAIKNLLHKLGWFSSDEQKFFCESNKKILEAPWISRKYSLPHNMAIFPWKEIKPNELAQIKYTQESEAWIEKELNPFLYNKNFEPLNSLGLRYKNQVVGWMLTTRISPDTICYECMFVRKDFRKMCRGIALLVNAIQLQAQAQVPYGIWHIDIDNYSMMRFVKKHLKPYLISAIEVDDYLKLLTCG